MDEELDISNVGLTRTTRISAERADSRCRMQQRRLPSQGNTKTVMLSYYLELQALHRRAISDLLPGLVICQVSPLLALLDEANTQKQGGLMYSTPPHNTCHVGIGAPVFALMAHTSFSNLTSFPKYVLQGCMHLHNTLFSVFVRAIHQERSLKLPGFAAHV